MNIRVLVKGGDLKTGILLVTRKSKGSMNPNLGEAMPGKKKIVYIQKLQLTQSPIVMAITAMTTKPKIAPTTPPTILTVLSTREDTCTSTCTL